MFQEETPIYSESGDIVGSNVPSNSSGLSPALLMPNSVGDFYLGEPAHFLISVQNVSNPPVTLTNVRTLIQTEARNSPRRNCFILTRLTESKYFKLILIFFLTNLTFHRTIKSVAHSSTYEKPLEPNDFMTVCVRVECRFPEEIQMMCNIDYHRDQGRDVLIFNKDIILY